MRHVLVMSTTGSIGLVSIFLVDFANLFYISLLGDPQLTAAVGFAGVVLYFHMSFCIGLMIAAVALTSRALGAGDGRRAREVASSALTIVALVTVALTLISMPLIDWMLDIIGAEGETKAVAGLFMMITLPTTPLLGVGMCLMGILRSAGDAKRAMYTTLFLGLTTAILDPILIYGLGFGVPGAAIVVVISRVLMVAYAFAVVTRVHDLLAWPKISIVVADFMPLARIGVPAVLTNIATPFGNGYVTAEVAGFGDQAVAGWTIVARLVPVAFGVLFALSGAIGPIIGQNFGARAFSRIRRDDGRQHGLRRPLHAGRLSAPVRWPRRHRGDIRGQWRGRAACHFLLHVPGAQLRLQCRIVRRQRRFQQSRIPASVDSVQLGAGNHRHRAVCMGRREDRRRRGCSRRIRDRRDPFRHRGAAGVQLCRRAAQRRPEFVGATADMVDSAVDDPLGPRGAALSRRATKPADRRGRRANLRRRAALPPS